MALSRLAREFAAEINNHDWSDAPYRTDRAGHRRENDPNAGQRPPLGKVETDAVRMNVMWVVAQVLGHADPNLDEFEFAEACGVDTRTPSGRPRSGVISAGLRTDHDTGAYDVPGALAADDPNEDAYDRRPDRVATDAQRTRTWPADPKTRGFTTRRGQCVHSHEQCPKYRYGIASAERHGRRIHPIQWTTTGQAHAAGKAVCSFCWS
ncbi:hypothetical protein DMP15_18660 [Pseudonocardia sp. UM4_GMWB1]|jgi:hypothetical protein|uniref:hypothetical protein n=1 Tax=Pseudonocardia sp. UM4_GMWB1 TaxID=2212989 RepID=UPI00307EB08C